MIIGDKSKFAIESHVAVFYENLSILGVGLFVIYILGRRYGVYEPDATSLGCSYNEVHDRLLCRGSHTAPFALEPSGAEIADAVRVALYAHQPKGKNFFGFSLEEFEKYIYSNRLIWCPDGDEAFDDGSFILQFDVGDRVRLIGFKAKKENYLHDTDTLSDIWLDSDEFYYILKNWKDSFNLLWSTAKK